MNKKAFITILAFLWLAGCYMIGQLTHKRAENTVSDYYSSCNLWDVVYSGKAKITGYSESSDYPFGYNVGAIEDDEMGKSIFLTPGTAISVSISDLMKEDISLQARIHPWVASSSDGALLQVSVLSDDLDDLFVYDVTNSETTDFVIEANSIMSSTAVVSFSVSNSENKDESCDWVIIQEK